jgi:hypothetical protein
MRVLERYYLRLDGQIVTENDRTAGNVLVASPGDEIPDAIAAAAGFNRPAAKREGFIKTVGVHLRHSNSTGAIKIEIPQRSLLLDVFVICTEAAAGTTTRPNQDFGEKDGDADGILDGLGQLHVCDVPSTNVELTPDFLGRGALLTSDLNEGPLRTKITKYYPIGVTLQNTCNSPGDGTPAGEWDIYIMYIELPEVI